MGEIEIGRFRYENLGFIFQEFNLLGTLTILENIAVPLTLKNVSRAEIVSRVEAIAKKLEITALLHKFPDECSGGQRQRVAIARAIAGHPKILFADEPTAELDSAMAAEVVELFREITRTEGVTILMTTHDMGLMDAGDMQIELLNGEVVCQK